MLDRDWLNRLIDYVEDDSMDESEWTPWWSSRLEILRDAILAAPPVPLSDPELTPIMKESMRLMDEVMALTYQRDAMERRAEAAEADWQRCEAELKSYRAAAPEPPAPQITREWINERMNEVAACVQGGVSLSWADGWAACREQVLSGIESLLVAAELPSAPVPCDHIVKAGWFGDTPLTKIRGAKFCVECGAALKDREGE